MFRTLTVRTITAFRKRKKEDGNGERLRPGNHPATAAFRPGGKRRNQNCCTGIVPDWESADRLNQPRGDLRIFTPIGICRPFRRISRES